MRFFLRIALGLAVGSMLVWVGCTDVQGPDQSTSQPAFAPKPPAFPGAGAFVTTIDNPYHPLVPGTTYFYEGESDGTPTSDVFFVTHNTRVLMGVTCIEVHDQAFVEGDLVEDTRDWFAQDEDGNVWYFGEDTRELDVDGNVISTEGSWLAGVDGAQPGIIMLAAPSKNDTYMQEVAPGVAEDQAKVMSIDESVTVPYGSFEDVLLTKETTPLDRSSVENKYYAPGVGFILGVQVKGGDDVTRLVNVTTGG